MDRFYHLLEDSVRLKPHPIFFSKTSPEISMYAKLLLRRNNMKRPSERRSFILRPNPWCQRRLSNLTDHFLELFLRGRTPAGTLKTFVVILFASTFVKRARLLLVIQNVWWLNQKKRCLIFTHRPANSPLAKTWPNLTNNYENREAIYKYLLHSIIFKTESMTSFNKFIETVSFVDHKTREVLVLIWCRDNLQAKILSLDKTLSKDRPMKLVLKWCISLINTIYSVKTLRTASF